MINFKNLENNIDSLSREFESCGFPYVVVDDFLNLDAAKNILSEFPDPVSNKIKKSRDYIFAKNKYEKSDLISLGESCELFRNELLSERFRTIICSITGEDVFVDPSFHGGGLHQGGAGSFLNMHTDFNYHPAKNEWFRNLNILIYFNQDWLKEFGGELKLVNKVTGDNFSVEPVFNRCVIMLTRDYTLHGYDAIQFPSGTYRRSIAAYAYSIDDSPDKNISSTRWFPKDSNILKRVVGRNWPRLVGLKTKMFGSSTGKNK
jgi:hypothetical protein